MAAEESTTAVHERGCPRENVEASRFVGHLGYTFCRDCRRHVKETAADARQPV